MIPAIQTADELITAPDVEPLDLATTKRHLRVTSNLEDDLVTLWIGAARLYFEQQTGRQLITATWEYQLAQFPAGPLELPRPPLLELISLNEVLPAAGTYTIQAPTGPYATRGVLLPAAGQAWPAIATPAPGAVRVRYKAGYGAAATDVPPLVKAALLLIVGHFYQFRAETHEAAAGALEALPLSAKIIMEAFRYSALPAYPPRAATL